MYVGNLERYQGIDLLLDSFARARLDNAHLVIIGGAPEHIRHYQHRAAQLGIASRVHLIGSRPVAALPAYLAQADILVSPRIKGVNTPMKIYSYLASGRPVVATDLKTHTQVLNPDVALLAQPTPQAFAEGLARLAHDAALRQRLGENGQRLIAEKHNYTAFVKTFNALLDGLAPQAV
ncbi:MAG: glycosyltransferase [Chloroflexi bacterium]|nr:glycosyltransferase [Chloroflexota bacterium]